MPKLSTATRKALMSFIKFELFCFAVAATAAINGAVDIKNWKVYLIAGAGGALKGMFTFLTVTFKPEEE